MYGFFLQGQVQDDKHPRQSTLSLQKMLFIVLQVAKDKKIPTQSERYSIERPHICSL